MSDILYIDGTERTTNAVEEKKEIVELVTSMKRRRILDGRLVDIIGEEDRLRCTVMYKGIEVVIPLSEMGIHFLDDDEEKKDSLVLVRLAENMLGSDVSFIVTHVEKTELEETPFVEYAFSGSVKAAKEAKIDRYYCGENPIIHEGMDLEVRVEAISKYGTSLYVDAQGFDVRMTREDLMYEWVLSLRDHFKMGDRFIARVKKIRMKDGKPTEVSLDAKCLKENRVEKVLNRLSNGDKCIGTIIGVAENSPYFIALDNGANATAYEVRTNIKVPCVGDRVRFLVTSFTHARGTDRKENAIGLILDIFS